MNHPAPEGTTAIDWAQEAETAQREIHRLRALIGQERVECANTAQATADELGEPAIGFAIAKAIRARPIVTY